MFKVESGMVHDSSVEQMERCVFESGVHELLSANSDTICDPQLPATRCIRTGEKSSVGMRPLKRQKEGNSAYAALKAQPPSQHHTRHQIRYFTLPHASGEDRLGAYQHRPPDSTDAIRREL